MGFGRECSAHRNRCGPEKPANRTIHAGSQHWSRTEDGRCFVQLEDYRPLPIFWTEFLRFSQLLEVLERRAFYRGNPACGSNIIIGEVRSSTGKHISRRTHAPRTSIGKFTFSGGCAGGAVRNYGGYGVPSARARRTSRPSLLR